MELQDVLSELEAAGTAQNRKIYARHGVKATCHGVSYADIGRLAKRIGTDHDLTRGLWRSGVHDARELAGRIVDHDRVTRADADEWVRDADNYVTAGTVAGMISHTGLARSCSDRWRDRKDEWIASSGWTIVTFTASDPEHWTVPELRELVVQIETEIHDRPNRVRHEMNGALIVIALRDGNIRRTVLAASRRIGPISVDHGQTGCVTPDLAPYVERTLAHQARMAAR